MPELWLPYGGVEVVLDIKAENLAEVITAKTHETDDTGIKERIKQLPLKSGSSLVLVDCEEATLQFLGLAISMLSELGIVPESLSVQCQKSHLFKVKKICENTSVKVSQIGVPDQSVGEGDKLEIMAPSAVLNDQAVIVTETRLDPLFGFTGGAASLIRLLNDEVMAEAFGRRANDEPHPGKDTPSNDFSQAVIDPLSLASSVEIVSMHGHIADILSGGLRDTHQLAKKRATELVTYQVAQPAKIVVLSPGHDRDSTLSSSLDSAWNVLGALREKGWLIIAAECSQGLGSEAMELLGTGRIRIESKKYVRGLEDVVFLRNVNERNNLVMVSTLPHYYLSVKLGLRIARRLQEAFHEALEALGSRAKAHIVTSSADILLASKES